MESARGLALRLEGLAREMGDPAARFHIVGHSMGGLVARYYLRYGGAEPAADAPVTWAGARRIASVVLAATPNGGSIPALGAVLSGERVGLSYTTLAASVVSRMPSIYQLLPPAGTQPLVDPRGQAARRGPARPRNVGALRLGAVRARLGRPHGTRAGLPASPLSIARGPSTRPSLVPRRRPAPCPSTRSGATTLLTLARAVAGEGPAGSPPRLEARTRREQDLLYEAGDGRVTRASLLAAHLPGADGSPSGSGLPEIVQTFFGGADHHGLYADPAFQSLLLRLLLRPRPAPELRPARAPLPS